MKSSLKNHRPLTFELFFKMPPYLHQCQIPIEPGRYCPGCDSELKRRFRQKNLVDPQVGLMVILSQGIVQGKMAWPLIIVGLFMGMVFIIMHVRSPMLVSVSMYLPLETPIAIFLDCLIKGIVDIIVEKRKYADTKKERNIRYRQVYPFCKKVGQKLFKKALRAIDGQPDGVAQTFFSVTSVSSVAKR